MCRGRRTRPELTRPAEETCSITVVVTCKYEHAISVVAGSPIVARGRTEDRRPVPAVSAAACWQVPAAAVCASQGTGRALAAVAMSTAVQHVARFFIAGYAML